MKQWEFIRYNASFGLTREVVIANTVYDALIATGNLSDFEIISIKLLTSDV